MKDRDRTGCRRSLAAAATRGPVSGCGRSADRPPAPLRRRAAAGTRLAPTQRHHGGRHGDHDHGIVRVLKAVGTPFGGKPAYSIIANLEFATADQFRAAVAAEGGPVFGDVPNFSNKDPVVVIADLVGSADPA